MSGIGETRNTPKYRPWKKIQVGASVDQIKRAASTLENIQRSQERNTWEHSCATMSCTHEMICHPQKALCSTQNLGRAGKNGGVFGSDPPTATLYSQDGKAPRRALRFKALEEGIAGQDNLDNVQDVCHCSSSNEMLVCDKHLRWIIKMNSGLKICIVFSNIMCFVPCTLVPV